MLSILGLMLGRSEPVRALAAIVCLGLLVQSWFVQKQYARSRRQLVLVTLILSLPALASVWLGLNVIRFYSYDGDPGPGIY